MHTLLLLVDCGTRGQASRIFRSSLLVCQIVLCVQQQLYSWGLRPHRCYICLTLITSCRWLFLKRTVLVCNRMCGFLLTDVCVCFHHEVLCGHNVYQWCWPHWYGWLGNLAAVADRGVSQLWLIGEYRSCGWLGSIAAVTGQRVRIPGSHTMKQEVAENSQDVIMYLPVIAHSFFLFVTVILAIMLLL